VIVLKEKEAARMGDLLHLPVVVAEPFRSLKPLLQPLASLFAYPNHAP
jgi:hypothetical protein